MDIYQLQKSLDIILESGYSIPQNNSNNRTLTTALRVELFKCLNCEFVNNSIKRVRQHFSNMHEKWPLVRPKDETLPIKTVYVCSLCSRQYALEEDLRGHMLEYHKCRSVIKTNNNLEFQTTEQISNSEESSVNMRGLPEQRRKFSISDVTDERQTHPIPFKNFRLILRAKMTLRCSFSSSCSFKFENSSKLDMHINCHRAILNQFNCFKCGLETKNWRHCSAHLWKEHHVDVDLLSCPLCNFKAHASVLVWRHMRNHKKWRPHVLRSLHVIQQRRHQNIVQLSNGKLSSFSEKNKYYAEKTCEICNRKFVNGKTLSKHVKMVHNKIKPFICSVCGKNIARKASLTIHMRQHTGEKPLHCKTCKFSTRDPSVLYKHQLRHDKAKKFKCSICDYKCIQTNTYKRHIKFNHPDDYKKIACNLCNYVTINEQRLESHKEDHRNGLISNNEDSMDAIRITNAKSQQKLLDKINKISADSFVPLESNDSLPHEPAVDTGGVTIPASVDDTQFPVYLSS